MLLPHIKFFLKRKRGPELVSQPHFLYDFWRKIFLILYSINWPSFIVLLSLLFKMSGNMFNMIVCVPVCDVISIEIYVSFLIKSISYKSKRRGKNLNILRMERAFKMKKKSCFLICKGLSLKQIKPTFLKGESPTLRLKICK